MYWSGRYTGTEALVRHVSEILLDEAWIAAVPEQGITDTPVHTCPVEVLVGFMQDSVIEQAVRNHIPIFVAVGRRNVNLG